ncbi:signal peptidase II [Caloranaerobacter azorensis DSM 13643]|uniref:Lipoprotein signal peptidase n=1 Tax=Caloranaerobacter azorensis DSM 13643 TaxID=1121264 RepID=A0A1M5S9Q6_9FIRM|nr:signal peptidase II [Caloranaerobacter azorensis]SHH35327.1 signal peptidase II [Caloranaerobacter azorensis DSM 13643]
MFYIIAIILIIFDQLTKYLAVKFLLGKNPIPIIKNYLQLNYVENFGAAFGILQNKQLFFVVITIVVLAGIIVYIRKHTNISKPMKAALTILFSGALGNLIDRLRLGYVIDFIDVKFGKLYDFPVFNVADCLVVVSTIIIAYLVLYDKYEINMEE